MQHSTVKKASIESKMQNAAKKASLKKPGSGIYLGRKSGGTSVGHSTRAISGVQLRAAKDSRVISQIKSLATNYFTNSIAAQILDVSPKTFSRYLENAKPLSAQQKDRINIVESIVTLGKRVLGDEGEVKRWLRQPVHSIENQRPIDLIVSESGRRRVENVLLQIEGGAY